MRKLLTAAVTVAASISLVAGLSAPASARPLSDRDVLKVKDAASIYPGLKGGVRFKGKYGIVAPRFVVRHGRLKCDHYRKYRGVSRRNSYIFSSTVERAVGLNQSVVRFRTVKRAKALMRHYRGFIRKCRGTHPTTDGEGGKARMKVRGWRTPRIGDGSVGMLEAFVQYHQANWVRTVVARTGRTVSIQEAEIYSGKGRPRRANKISRKAIAKLS